MDGQMIAFIIWAIVGFIIIGIGISAFFRRKAAGFWANIEAEPMKDIKKYNHALGKLLIAFGVVFIILGIPLLGEQNSPIILLSVFGVVIEIITTMIIYTLVIEEKYRAN